MPNHLARFMRYGLAWFGCIEGWPCFGRAEERHSRRVQAMQLAEDFVKDANVAGGVYAGG